jgi:hypothetical protein
MLLVFKRLFTELDVYLELSGARLRTVLSVFLVGLSALSFSNGTAAALLHGPEILKSSVQLADTVVSWWPADQVAHWRDGKLSITPAPAETKQVAWPIVVPEELTKQFMAYSPVSLSQPDDVFLKGEKSVLFLVTPDQLWVNQLDGEWSTTMPLVEVFESTGEMSGDYSKADFTHLVGQTQAAVRKLLKVALILWPLMSVFGTWLSMAWFVMIEAALVWLITKLFGWNLSWSRLAKLNCLLVIPATALQYAASWLYPELSFSLFHITYWVLLSLVLLVGTKELEKSTI